MFNRNSLLSSAAGLAVLLSVLAAGVAQASVGYLLQGQGFRYKALSGAGVALHLDPTAAALNPGAMAFVPGGYDVSMSVILPNSKYTVTGEPSADQDTYFGLEPGEYSGEQTLMVAPTISGNWSLNEDETFFLGLTIFSQGGMKTEYAHGVYDASAQPTGVDLTQMTAMPTLSYMLGERHGLGFSPLFTMQRYRARGLQPLGDRGWSSDPENLTNKGTDTMLGYGVRIGYLGEWLDLMSVGVSYQTKTYMSASTDYAGWLAEQGILENPASWTAGVAFGFVGMGLALDVQQALHSDLKSLGNPLLPNLDDALLGDDEGAGPGWENTLSFRMGAWYQTNSGWMVRLGFATGDQPVADSETFFNILTPQVAKHQVSLGLSRPLGFDNEIGIVVAYGLENTLTGVNPLETSGAQTIALTSSQWEVGLGLSF